VRQDTAATKARILTAAEQLLADKGVENVSLAEINRKAGQKNSSALQYHFGGKKALIEAILHRHLLAIHADRNAMLDELERATAVSLRDVAEAIVIPLANRLADSDGGLHYIRITAQLIGKKGFPYLDIVDLEQHFSTQRVWKFTLPLTAHVPAKVQLSRNLLLVSTLFHGLANYATLISSTRSHPEGLGQAIFVADLVDCVEALLEKKPSRHTTKLLG
jgi:AcrR family transcriptional regulator